MEKVTLFKIALAIKSDSGQRYTAKDFAEDVGINRATLHCYLDGQFTSARLDEEVDSFIRDQLSKWDAATSQPVLA